MGLDRKVGVLASGAPARLDDDTYIIRDGNPYRLSIEDILQIEDAAFVGFTPAGGLISDNVQSAIEELDASKLPRFGHDTLAATGTTQLTAAPILKAVTNITTSAGQQGAILPAATPEALFFLNGAAGNGVTLVVYPALGERIGAQAINVGVQLAFDTTGVGFGAIFYCSTTGVWTMVQNPKRATSTPTALGGAQAASPGSNPQYSAFDHAHALNDYIPEGASAAHGTVPSPGVAKNYGRVLRASGGWGPESYPAQIPAIGELLPPLGALGPNGIGTAAALFAFPFVVPIDMTFDQAMTDLVTAQTSGAIRVGFYDWANSNHEAGGPLIAGCDFGQIDLSTGGGGQVKNVFGTAKVVAAGIYWANVYVSSTAAQPTAMTITALIGAPKSDVYKAGLGSRGFAKAASYPGSMPSNMPTGFGSSNANIPGFYLRRSA